MKKVIMLMMVIPFLSFAAANTPVFNSIVLTGSSNLTVQIDGSVFLSGGRVELVDPASANEIVGRYYEPQYTISSLGGGAQRITLPLRPLDAATLRIKGTLKFYVINPAGNGETNAAFSMIQYSGGALPYPGRTILPMVSGGSVYTLYHIGAYADAVRPTVSQINDLWYHSDTNNLRSVIGMYHIDSAEIDRQLQEMYDLGQRRIAFNLSCLLGVASNQLNSAGLFGPYPVGTESNGVIRLTAQSESNFTNLLKKVAQIGFKEVGIRFCVPKSPQSASWTNEAVRAYETGEDWEFIVHYRSLTESILKPAGVTRYYDLNPERAGVWNQPGMGNYEQYNETIWSNYWATVKTAYDTFGLSFATAPGVVTNQLALYQRVGHYPPFYGFDMYDDIFRKLAFVRDELAVYGQTNKPIMLEETYYDDAQNLLEVDAARKLLGLNILYVNHWPLSRDFLAPHYTEDYPRDYCYTQSNFDSLCPDMTGYTSNSAQNISSVTGSYGRVTVLPTFRISASGLTSDTEVALVRSGTGPLTGDSILAVYDSASFSNATTFVSDGYIDLTLDRAMANAVETAAYRTSIPDPSFVLLRTGTQEYSSVQVAVPFVELPRPQITNVVRSGNIVWVWGLYFGEHAYLNLWDTGTIYQGLDAQRVDHVDYDIIKITLSDTDAARMDSGPTPFFVINKGATFAQGTSVFSPAYTYP